MAYVLSKVYYLEAACLVRYAMVHYDNCKYGDQISCLLEAERLMLKTKSLKNNLPDDYYEDLKVKYKLLVMKNYSTIIHFNN